MKEIGKVQINTQETTFHLTDDGLVRAERWEQVPKAKVIQETFAEIWFIGFLKSSQTPLKLRSGNKLIEPKETLGILIPPFSLLEWHLEPGLVQWTGYFSKKPFHSLGQSKPFLFNYQEPIPHNYTELIKVLESISHFKEIETSKDNSWLSQKVKNIIDQNYKEELKVEDIASQLKVHRSFMARSFKKSYGLSPVEYRHKLRVFEGLKLMNQENFEITRAAVDSGFSSIHRFEDHFKRQLGITPSEFSFGKLKVGLV